MKKNMKNNYSLLGEVTRLSVGRKDFCLIDTSDYCIVKKFVWTISNSGKYKYVKCSKTKKHAYIMMHRLIMKAPRDKFVDHINHDTLDNRRCNLRICTNSQNQMNSVNKKTHSKSKFLGVTWVKSSSSWIGRISAGGKRIHLGTFKTELDCAKEIGRAHV